MTNAEIDALETAAKAATPGPWEYDVEQGEYHGVWAGGRYIVPSLHIDADNCKYIAAANPAVILELIAELRQTRKERNYLAWHRPVRYCPTLQKWEVCDLPDFDGPHMPLQCFQCWRQAAKEAVCKNQSES